MTAPELSVPVQAAIALTGGFLGGLALFTVAYANRHRLQRDLVAVKPYDQAATITTTISKLRGNR